MPFGVGGTHIPVKGFSEIASRRRAVDSRLGLGFLLASPHLLPLLEYAKTGSRMMQRSEGQEERPPVGLAALPQVVLPDIYGTRKRTAHFSPPAQGIPEGNLLESASAAYAGVLATLLVAPGVVQPALSRPESVLAARRRPGSELVSERAGNR